MSIKASNMSEIIQYNMLWSVEDHFLDNQTGTLSIIQITATHLKIGYL